MSEYLPGLGIPVRCVFQARHAGATDRGAGPSWCHVSQMIGFQARRVPLYHQSGLRTVQSQRVRTIEWKKGGQTYGKAYQNHHHQRPCGKSLSVLGGSHQPAGVWPSLVEVKDVEPLPNGGTRYGWVYKMAGVLLKGTLDTTEYVANQRMVWRTEGSIESKFTWEFQPEDGGTKLVHE